ncbi:hypothetical protein EUX98_g2291 [Antrodiella citrinella]|uniref:Uncharacterized protein n=1 Tax=Antrodiella citrinella TaxID=2447956 RepID=A0A4S4N2D3_9APHY|nr:hypothetical protein EUX98_g2291 [Antrodiella citrinella]
METQRADDAESRTKDVVFRFKEATDGRLAAQTEAARYREELNLYKLQLDNAQRELRRAQELLDAVERQRVAAEEEAARARGMARKLKEEKVIQVARDEGRKLGIEEGIARGRAMGYEEGRAAGFARGRSSAAKEYLREEFEVPSPIRISVSSSDSSTSPPRRSAPVPIPPQQQQQQGTPPEDIRIASPRLNVSPRSMNVYTPTNAYTPVESQTPNARSSVHSFTQMTSDYPQDDGWIPKIDEDGRVRLPPPHELASSPVPSPPAPTPALMVPPPLPQQQPNNSDSDTTTPTEPTTPGRPRYRRRRSTESNSTTMSQFDILGPPPVAASGRNDRTQVLSAIVEEKERTSTVSSPRNPSGSPYAYTSSPSFVMPIARPDHPGTPQAQGENYYSRPDSHMSQEDATQQEPSLLMPEDAARPPPAEAPESSPILAPQPTGHGSLSALALPLHLPADDQLPPGFVPAGPPSSVSRTPAVIPSNLGGIYTNPSTPAAIPLPPSAVPTVHRLQYTPSVAGTHVTGDPGVVIPPSSTIPSQANRVDGHVDHASSTQEVVQASTGNTLRSTLRHCTHTARRDLSPTHSCTPTTPSPTYAYFNGLGFIEGAARPAASFDRRGQPDEVVGEHEPEPGRWDGESGKGSIAGFERWESKVGVYEDVEEGKCERECCWAWLI